MPGSNSGTSSGFGSTPSTPATTPPSYNLGNFYQGGFGQPQQQGGQPNGPSFGSFLNAIAPGANSSNPGFSLYGTQSNFSPQGLMRQVGQMGQGNPNNMARQLGNAPLAAPDQSYLNTQPGYVHYDPSMPSGRGGGSEMSAGWNSGFQPTQLPPGLALQTMGNQWRMVPGAFGGNLGMSQGRGGRGLLG